MPKLPEAESRVNAPLAVKIFLKYIKQKIRSVYLYQ